MHDQTIPNSGCELEDAERAVLLLLVGGDGSGLWSTEELGRAVGDALTADLAVASLHASGLAQRMGGFVFASQAAARFCHLVR
jgi:hypothetical protein